MKAKIIIVTGASGAIGAEVCRALLEQGHYVIMACRNLEKGQRVLDSVWEQKTGEINRARLMELDLASLDSVCRFVAELVEAKLPIDGVVNNAGTMMRRFSETEDGLEATLQINYAAVFLLNELLMPIFDQNAVIVNVNSQAKSAKRLTRSLFEADGAGFSQIGAYAASKTALTVYTASLSRQTAGKLRVNVADPGIVNSDLITLGRWFDPLADLVFRPFIKSPRQGAQPILNALFAAESGMQFAGKKRKVIDVSYARHPLEEWLREETENRVLKSEKGESEVNSTKKL